MKNKIKMLLSCVALICALSLSVVACGTGSSSETESTPESIESIESVGESESVESVESTPESEESTPESEESTPESTPEEECLIVFVDYDGREISRKSYVKGEEVVAPADPTREADKTYTYVFAGWDSEVGVAEEDKTYTATYTGTYIEYTVIFLDEEGTELSNRTYHYGDTVEAPQFPDVEPTEVGYPTYSWDKEVVAVEDHATYTRVCDFVYTEYTVKFVGENGEELSSNTYHYGDAVVAPDAPTKEADQTYTYEFAGWDKEVVAVDGDATYTAVFNPVYIDYTVKFVNEDGEELVCDTYHFGDEVTLPEETPVKAENELFTFAFAGWDKEVVAVDGDATYTATYSATLKSGMTASETVANGDGIILNAGNIGGGANYEIGENHDDGDETPSSVRQAYLAIDGNFGFGSYIALDFTGKNMPEVMFFAKNYTESMYYAEGKQGIVVASGITLYNGAIGSAQTNNTMVSVSGPFGAYAMGAEAPHGGNMMSDFASALARANLTDGVQYRVIMGIVRATDARAFTVKYSLYNLTTGETVETVEQTAWNFFDGANGAVNNMTLDGMTGSIVLYGKFGTATTIDKVWGIYEGITIDEIANGIANNTTHTVNFKDANGEVLETLTGVPFGSTVSFSGTISSAGEDSLFTYTYVWDKPFGRIVKDTDYTLVKTATAKDGYKANNVTTQGDVIVLGAGSIGGGANYTIGQNNDDGDSTPSYVRQAYFGIDGNFALNNYITFDFTGKNMPEVAFFAKNYNDSMYADGISKQGIVVVTGITDWQGNLSGVNGSGTQINYGYPYMIQDAENGGFVSGAFANSALGRANLVDGTHYRVIMGFTGSGNMITLNWCLYNLDTNTEVEKSSMTTWGFFSGSNAQVGNMTINDLVGSIVLYGKFGTTCTIDKLHGVTSGTFDEVVAQYTTQA